LRLLTSPGSNGALELVSLFEQLAGDFWGVIFSLLGGKALCDGEGIHFQRSIKESCTVTPHRERDPPKGRAICAESWNWTRGAARPIVIPCCIEMRLNQKKTDQNVVIYGRIFAIPDRRLIWENVACLITS
jgi:hypothetical protein